MEFTIRAARDTDIAAMHRIRCSVRENRLCSPSRVTGASYRPYIQAGTAWVAEEGRRILGFAALDLRSSSVWALFVAPGAEGVGIGRALHGHMLARAQDMNVGQLWLHTSPGTRAERFYASAGWQNTGLTPDGELRLQMRLHA